MVHRPGGAAIVETRQSHEPETAKQVSESDCSRRGPAAFREAHRARSGLIGAAVHAILCAGEQSSMISRIHGAQGTDRRGDPSPWPRFRPDRRSGRFRRPWRLRSYRLTARCQSRFRSPGSTDRRPASSVSRCRSWRRRRRHPSRNPFPYRGARRIGLHAQSYGW